MTSARIQVRRDTAADWTSNNPTLAAGEIGWESDTDKLKIGDGATAWTSLSYFTPGTGSASFHGCKAVRTGLSLTNNTSTLVDFTGTDDYDTDAIHNPSSNASRFTIPTGLDGVWRFTAGANFASHASSTSRALGWKKNGTDLATYRGWNRMNSIAGVSTYMVATMEENVAAGDYIELTANQASGGSLSFDATVSATYLGAP